MSNKDPNYIPKLEKAIAQKYGAPTVGNPRQNWDEEKEQEYIKCSIEERQKFSRLSEKDTKVEQDGFLINQKLLNKDTNRVCQVCEKYSFDIRDGMYMNKFSACFLCYIQWIEDREERWKNGWRPTKRII